MSFPQYYKILNITSTATSDQIRQAYKKESLKTHPDRLPKGSTTADKKRATERFQAVADAYYVLSDPTRRRDYDDLARQRGGRSAGPGAGGFSSTGGGSSQQQSGAGGAGGFPDFDFSDFMNNMNNARKRQSSSRAQEAEEEEEEEYEEKRQNDESSGFFKTFAGMFGYGGKKNDGRPDANKMFGDVFEDMLAPEVAHVRPYWSYLGGASGAALGFIVGNAPGAVAGGLAGNRLGAVRDAKGKSVAEVFTSLDAGSKAEILRVLAMKVLGHVTS